jgi:hypothetical protein
MFDAAGNLCKLGFTWISWGRPVDSGAYLASRMGGGIKATKAVKKAAANKTTKKTTKKAATCKWMLTSRTVTTTIQKQQKTRAVYRNTATGELRVRKMVTRPDGTKRASYIKF